MAENSAKIILTTSDKLVQSRVDPGFTEGGSESGVDIGGEAKFNSYFYK